MVETRDNEYRAYFTVTGEFDPAEITARLRLEPTSSWKKGDRNEKTHHERKFSRWSLDSRLGKFETLENQISDVLHQLQPHSEEIKVITKVYGGVMQLVGYFYCEYPGLHFESQQVIGLASLGLAIDFDFYYMYSDAREDS
jgi:hypothetical protein